MDAAPSSLFDSERTLAKLLESGGIELQASELLRTSPAPLPPDFAFGERIEGMMLGLAIGDALGRPTEGRIPARRRKTHGEVRDYVIGRRAKQAIGMPSDDTQLAFWTLEQLNEDGAFIPDRLATIFSQREIFGMGQTVSAFRRNFKKSKRVWHRCGPNSAGNGALMRIAPMLIPHLRNPSPALWSDTALSAMMTHNDPASTAACVAFVAMLWELLTMEEAPEQRWWLERYVELAAPLEGKARYQPRGGDYMSYEGPVSRFVEQRVSEALDTGMATVPACNSWFSGAYLLETMPCVILILARYGHEPEEAIVRAVNDTKDNDTVAAIVGAAMGALHGKSALPERWLSGLTGRTGHDDDGRCFELLAAARPLWAPEAGT